MQKNIIGISIFKLVFWPCWQLNNFFISKTGLVWTEGYANGSLKGHVYPDVPEAFKSWRADNLSIAIYSSGSVKAQKLLFGQSIAGDLLPYIADHFDTVIGHKQQQESYANIVEKLQVKAEHVVFLTDIIKGLSRMMIWN